VVQGSRDIFQADDAGDATGNRGERGRQPSDPCREGGMQRSMSDRNEVQIPGNKIWPQRSFLDALFLISLRNRPYARLLMSDSI